MKTFNGGFGGGSRQVLHIRFDRTSSSAIRYISFAFGDEGWSGEREPTGASDQLSRGNKASE